MTEREIFEKRWKLPDGVIWVESEQRYGYEYVVGTSEEKIQDLWYLSDIQQARWEVWKDLNPEIEASEPRCLICNHRGFHVHYDGEKYD